MSPRRPRTEPADLRAHALALAAAFKVRLIEVATLPPDEAGASATQRVAMVAPIIDETTYAVALHELGHCVAPFGSLRQAATRNNGNLMREEEATAWAWARYHALLWTPLMEHVATWAEGTYARTPPPSAPVAPKKPKRINWDDWK